MTSRQKLYAAGEPFGESATSIKPFGRIYGGGGGGGGTSTTTPMIPDELKGAASSLSKIATQVGNTPYRAYTGTGVVGLNGAQQAGLGMVADRALNGSPIMDQANSTLTQMLQGGQTNPYLDQMVQRAQDSVRSNMTTSMIGSGSFGNSGVQEAAGKAMGDVASSMYGNAYETNAQRQMQALGMAPTFGNQAYTDAQQLLNAGGVAQNNAQDQADFNYQQYMNQQNYPMQQLSALSGTLSGMTGSQTNQTGGGK